MQSLHVFLDEWIIRALKMVPAVDENKLAAFRKSKEPSAAEACLKTGLLTPDALSKALDKTYQLSPVSIEVEQIDKVALSLIPEKICRRHHLIPFKLVDEKIYLAMRNPLDTDALADARTFSGRDVKTFFCLPSKLDSLFSLIFSPEFYIQDMLQRLEKPLTGQLTGIDIATEKEKDLEADESQSTVVRLVNLVIKKAIMMEASDIHIEHEENKSLVRFRIDGLLKNILILPRDLATGPVVARIKILSNLDISDHFRPQDGRARFRYGTTEIGFRISILPTSHGEKVVMRLLDKRVAQVPFHQLGFRPEMVERLSEIIKAEQGIILVTGPTGSGKTTTLYSVLNKLKTEYTNITTVEDPIEYRMEGINQVQVNEKQGLTFPVVLRSVLRQDPDIILIGEIRDLETAKIAIQAAMTGHLVFATLHTNDATSTVDRLRDIGIEPYKIASCLLAATSQRLIRKLCVHCKEKVPSEKILPQVKTRLKTDSDVFTSPGCPQCYFTGYKGQLPLLEFWEPDKDAKKSIAAGDVTSRMGHEAALNGSLSTFEIDALWHLSQGETSMEEILPFLSADYKLEPEGRLEILVPMTETDVEQAKPPLPVAEKPPVRSGPINPRSKNILVVDDDRMTRMIVSKTLEKEGYHVKEAENGAKALEQILNEKPDLLLLDLLMPEIQGNELLKSIRQVLGWMELPVVILTSVSDDKMKEDVLNLGATDYLIKPCHPNVVLSRVQGILKRTEEANETGPIPSYAAGGYPLALEESGTGLSNPPDQEPFPQK